MKNLAAASLGTLGLLLLAVGCGDDKSGASPGGSSQSSSTMPGPGGTCPTGDCDQAQVEAYGKCITDACDSQYTMCFGADYLKGTFSGVCGDYYNCLEKCSCTDNTCRQACGIAPSDCQLCIGNNIQACAANSGCKTPTCNGKTVDVKAPKTCDELAKCCAVITDSTQKSVCETEYNGSKMYGDTICNSFVQAEEALGNCP